MPKIPVNIRCLYERWCNYTRDKSVVFEREKLVFIAFIYFRQWRKRVYECDIELPYLEYDLRPKIATFIEMWNLLRKDELFIENGTPLRTKFEVEAKQRVAFCVLWAKVSSVESNHQIYLLKIHHISMQQVAKQLMSRANKAQKSTYSDPG